MKRKTERILMSGNNHPCGIVYDETNDQLKMARATEDGKTINALYLWDEINSQWNVCELDPHSGAMSIIEEVHHKVHVGMHFYHKDVITVANGDVWDFQWTIADTPWVPHLLFQLEPDVQIEWWIYEGVTINTPGTVITPTNNDFNSSNTSYHTLASIKNTSLALANADTAIAGATQKMHGKTGSGKVGGIHVRGEEIMLKRNTIYSMRAQVQAGPGYFDFNMSWYEHAPHVTPYGL